MKFLFSLLVLFMSLNSFSKVLDCKHGDYELMLVQNEREPIIAVFMIADEVQADVAVETAWMNSLFAHAKINYQGQAEYIKLDLKKIMGLSKYQGVMMVGNDPHLVVCDYSKR